MKKYITYLLASALLVPGFVSCNRIQEEEIPARTHRVHFTVSEAETRTGLSIDGTKVTPDWNKTEKGNIHLFEIDAQSAVAYGETLGITTDDSKKTAKFEADFPENLTISFGTDGSSQETGSTTDRVAPYQYAAVIAQKPSADGFTFVVPAEQHPDAETLKDPAADFLVGFSAEPSAEPHYFDEPVVDLYFTRAAALGQLAISNFSEGEKVQSVTIKSQAGLTGSAAYTNIDFENGTVTFTRAAGDLTLVYDNGAAVPASGPFYAYFVAIPGAATITAVEVVTDQFRYTKEIGKATTFSEKSFKNFTLDLSTATKVAVGPDVNTWYQASVLEDGIDYLIVSKNKAMKNNEGTIDAVSVTATDGVITFESTDPTLVWRATAHEEKTGTGSSDVVAGHFTLTNNGYYLQRNSSNILLDTEIPSDKPKYVVWDYDGSYLRHESSGTMTFYCYYSSGWETSSTQNGAAPGSSIGTVQIYTNRPPQAFEFTPKTVEYDFDAGGEFQEPGFTVAPVGDLTYSSSDETVATVNPSTGEVTILKAGTAVITVVAAGNNLYQAGTASYTINSTSKNIPVFYLATELEEGLFYLVVSGDYALQVDGTTLGTLAITGEAGDAAIQLPVGSSPTLFEAAEHIEYFSDNNPAGHYTLTYGGNYLQRYSSGTTQNGAIGDVPSDGKYYVWDYDGEHLYQISRTGNSGTYYLYYSSGWKFESSSTPKTYLYTSANALTSRKFKYSETEVSCVLGGTAPTWPTLQGTYELSEVTFSSSEPNVATVDASGVVTVKGLGETVIKAEVGATEQYAAGKAQFTLTVTDGSVQKWYKAEEIVAGETYLIVSNNQALKNDGSAVAVKEASGVVEYNAPDELIWKAATYSSSSSKFFFTNSNKYLTRSGSNSSYTPSTSSSSSTSSSTYNLWTYDSENVYLYATSTSSSSSKYYIYYSTNNSKWSMSSSSGDTHKAALYTTTKPKTDRALKYSKESVTYDLTTDTEASFAFPTLSGIMTGVTYSSSETGVATVDQTGKVSIKGVGKTVIKAEAAETGDYKAGSAEYTLTVVNGVSKFYKVEEVVAGKSYLIYSNGYILQNNSGSPAAVAATVTDDMIALDDVPESILWTATASSGKFTLSNDGRYLYRTSSSNKAQLSTSNQMEWSYDAENEFLNTVMSSSTYCFYYSTNGSEFRINTQDSDHHAILFVLDDGQPRTQTLKLSTGSVSFNINGQTTPLNLGDAAPTISGAKTTVNYDSSDKSVATVDADGKVSVLKVGTTTISAQAVAGTVGSKQYAASNQVSYILTVVNVIPPTMGSVESSFNLRVSSSTIVQELSGLCLSKDGNFLWGVGDKGTLYKIGFDGTSSTQWANGGTNMEGLAMDPNTGTMYMCFEPNDVYTLSDPYTSKTLLFEVAEASSMNNDGVEGIAWADGYLYLGSQTNATLWKYNVNGTKVWTKQLATVAPTITEVAGLDYDPVNDWLWVLDSEVKALYLFDGEATTLYATYNLSSIATQNPEGVCVDRKNGCIWICEDAASGSSPSKLHKIAFSNLGIN